MSRINFLAQCPPAGPRNTETTKCNNLCCFGAKGKMVFKKSKEDAVSLLVLVPAQPGFQAIQKTLPTHIRWYLNIMENKLIQVKLC